MQRQSLIGLSVLAVAATLGLASCNSSVANSSSAAKGGAAADRGVPVTVAAVVAKDVPVYLRGLGNVTAFNTVTIHTRVDGQLVEVNFKEGQDVKKGDLLVVVDPRPYQAALDQAKATLQKDEASQHDAQIDLARDQALAQDQVIAQQQLDTQRATVGSFAGQLAADKAAIETAALNLAYCHVAAPIPGRIGLRLVDIGNIVHASDTNGLLVITQMQPIAVIFTLPEDDIPQVLTHLKNGSLTADAYTRDDSTKIASGQLTTINNEIDPTTGTDRFKAIFSNEDRMLWPNQFVNIRLLIDVKKNAMTIPNAALESGAQGNFVYVVKPDKSVEARTVKVGINEGGTAEIDSGLSAGELVVTDGQDKLQPGSKVIAQQDGSRGPHPAAASGAPVSGSQ